MPPPRNATRAAAPLLDRLMDADPDRTADRPRTQAATIAALRHAVRRDVEALLNARRPWRSVPDRFAMLRVSPLGYGIPDFIAGGCNDNAQRERLRSEIETTIRRFEPRLAQVQVELTDVPSPLTATLTLRISALLRIEPEPEQVVFDTMLDTTTADVVLRPLGET
ncbi:MAG TPA: type VI secretion system baseplate subunit TssE [Pseudolabrys sp.]|nr:type VI secretion system baseplate subunit TssE [Pseudolabrys sp.]